MIARPRRGKNLRGFDLVFEDLGLAVHHELLIAVEFDVFDHKVTHEPVRQLARLVVEECVRAYRFHDYFAHAGSP
ncbi:hypothetical protein D3C71_2089700 [compost metagenome]